MQAIQQLASFEGADCPVHLVMEQWMKLLEQVRCDAELLAMGSVIEAVRWEVLASSSCKDAWWWVEQGRNRAANNFIDCSFSALRCLGCASQRWGQAATWLREYGDAQRQRVYGTLYEQVARQQQRLGVALDLMQADIQNGCERLGLSMQEIEQVILVGVGEFSGTAQEA